MQQFTSAHELKKHLKETRNKRCSVGFVPTMGALHRGHMALIDRALRENDAVVCSIFVNPTQFNNAEDLSHYPRTIASDLALLQEVGCTAAYLPDVNEMYPQGLQIRPTTLDGLDRMMEGEHRPGHFDGVVTIVRTLFEQINPNRAYFGTKDYQQLLIIKKLVAMEAIPIEIISCETVREPDGLALSSRNMRLSPQERATASMLPKALMQVGADAVAYSLPTALQRARKAIASFPELSLEYLEVAHRDTLQPIVLGSNLADARVFAACHCGPVRLIDNMPLFT